MKAPVLRLAAIAWLLMSAAVARSAQTNTPPAAVETLTPPAAAHEGSAVLYVFNRPVMNFRASPFGASPRQRVRAATERIDSLIHRKVFGPVQMRHRTEGLIISVGGEVVMMVAPGAVDPRSGRKWHCPPGKPGRAYENT